MGSTIQTLPHSTAQAPKIITFDPEKAEANF